MNDLKKKELKTYLAREFSSAREIKGVKNNTGPITERTNGEKEMNTQKLHKIKQINKLAARIFGPFAFVAFLFLGVIAFAECIAKMFLGLGF